MGFILELLQTAELKHEPEMLVRVVEDGQVQGRGPGLRRVEWTPPSFTETWRGSRNPSSSAPNPRTTNRSLVAISAGLLIIQNDAGSGTLLEFHGTPRRDGKLTKAAEARARKLLKAG